MSHVLICGLGQVGYRITSLLLRLGETVTVVTQDTRQEFVDLVEKAGAKIVNGDARADHVLLSAGLMSAKAIVACVDDDVTNIEIALDAQRLNPQIRIVTRLFDQALARRLESAVGIHKALGMSVLAAPTFAASAFGESLLGSFVWKGKAYVAVRGESVESGDQIVGLDEFAKVSLEKSQASPLTQASKLKIFFESTVRIWKKTPRSLLWVSVIILLLSIASVFIFQIGLHISPIDALYFVVTTVTTTGYGDITIKDSANWLKLYGCLLMLLGSAGAAVLYSMITDFVVSTRFDEVLGRRSTNLSDHVVVVGLGNVGYRTIERLREMGSDVAVVEIDADAPYRQLLEKRVVFTAGDGRDVEALERAGVRSARAVIIATQNDAVNLSAGLATRSINPRARVIVRIFDAGFAKKIEEVKIIDMAISASRIAAPGFIGATLFPEALLCYVRDNCFCIVRESPLTELKIDTVELKPEAVVS